MSTIKIHRKHNLDDTQIREHLQSLLEQFSSEYGIRHQWQGDMLELERSGAKGFIRLQTGELELELKLGMLLRPFKGKIEHAILEYMDKNLG